MPRPADAGAGGTADVTLTVVPTGGGVENVALSFSVLGEDQKPADPALVTVGDFKSTCVAGASFTFKVTAAAASSVTEKTLRYLSVKGTSGSIGGSRNLQIVLDPSSSSVVLLGADQQEGLEELRPAVGDSVKITSGAMAGFVGKVQEISDDKKKIKVIASLFGRETPVELDALQVKKN